MDDVPDVPKVDPAETLSRILGTEPLPEALTPLEKPYTGPEPTLLARIKAWKGILEVVAEEAILHAEVYLSDQPGEMKKAWVVDRLGKYLRELEGRFDLLPGPVERVALFASDWVLGWLVQRVFDALRDAGRV